MALTEKTLDYRFMSADRGFRVFSPADRVRLKDLSAMNGQISGSVGLLCRVE